MSWVDVVVGLLIVGYIALGLRQGVVRRLLGLVAVYGGFAGATAIAPLAGGIIQQAAPGLSAADARVYAYFGILILVTFAIEGLALAYRSQLEISYVAFDRVSGVAAGLLTALLASSTLVLLIGSAASPAAGPRDVLEVHLQDAFTHSRLGAAVAVSAGHPAEAFFYPALPHDPQVYFEGGVQAS